MRDLMRHLFGLLALVSACGSPHPGTPSSLGTCPSDMVAALRDKDDSTYIVRRHDDRQGRCAFVRKAEHAPH